jgi:hypothetical protein
VGGGSSVATLSIPQPRPVMVPNAACCSFWFRRVRTPVVRLRHRRDMAAGVSKLAGVETSLCPTYQSRQHHGPGATRASSTSTICTATEEL